MDGNEPASSARECLARGVALFNRGEFFEAHEAMEKLGLGHANVKR